MNKQALIDRLTAMAAENRSPEVKIFLRLLKQVWEIDYTVSAYDALNHVLTFDFPYFLRFMGLDEGDSAEEEQIVIDWINNRHLLTNNMMMFVDVIDEVNMARIETGNG